MAIFDFNSIPPCLHQWLPIITETSKIQCRIVISQVLDENQSIFLILLDSSMSSAKVADKKTTQLLWLLIKFPPLTVVWSALRKVREQSQPLLKTWKNRLKIKKTKFFYDKQLKLD